MNDNDRKLYIDYLNTNRGLIIAPAGYGKTYAIAEMVPLATGKVLILTHTHAGIASIKQKLRKQKVESNKFNIETISGYAQKYVIAFTKSDTVPEQSNSKEYYPFIHKTFKKLLERVYIQAIIAQTYSHIIVDEYQDCSEDQHTAILSLSSFISVHILGDEMQGIFNFNNQKLVDWQVVQQHYSLVKEFDTPWRWKQENANKKLGKQIYSIREKLIANEEINLNEYSEIFFNNFTKSDRTNFYRLVNDLLKSEKNLLIIDPISERKTSRLAVIKLFSNRIYMLESIDDVDFYKMSASIDDLEENFEYCKLLDFVCGIKNKKNKRVEPLMTNVGSIIGIRRPKSSRDPKIQKILDCLSSLSHKFILNDLMDLLVMLDNLNGVNVTRRELFDSLLKAMLLSIEEKQKVEKSMEVCRNQIRRFGKNLYGHTIGTTLLTKGLEIDAVLILDANEFCNRNMKNFYVAISRASKKLVIMSATNTLKFSNSDKLTK